MCITEKSEITREILAYLDQYPDAQDTLPGVAEWWLLEQRIERQTADVKEALADLVKKGLVVELKGNDRLIHYRINRRKRREITRLLKRGPQ